MGCIYTEIRGGEVLETRHRDKGSRAPRQDTETRGGEAPTRHRRQGSMDGVGVFQVGGLGHYFDEKYL